MVRIAALLSIMLSMTACSGDKPLRCSGDSDCQVGEVCDLDTGRCVPCQPACAGQCCGDDGCGGACPDDCPDGAACDPTTCTCACVPDCTGKCCGDDGCGGTCPDGCAEEDLVCAPATCTCAEAGQFGDPCPLEHVHQDRPACDASEGLFCFDSADFEHLGTCPNGTDEECEEAVHESRWNSVCVDGVCRGSYCNKECKRTCDCCPNGYYPFVVGEKMICLPGWAEQSGRVCPFGPVNDCFDGCAMDSSCVGSDPSAFIGLCPSGFSEECKQYIPERFYPDCIDGLCGIGFCSPRCDNGTCDSNPGYEPTDISGACYCFPISEPSAEGMRCRLGEVNALWGACQQGLTCVGLPADGSHGDCPNGIPDCEDIPSSQNPFCTSDPKRCGASFCARPCDAGSCGDGFVPFQFGGTCFCAPAE